MTDKPWITAGPIDAALAEFETALGPAWSRPAAHGIAHDVDVDVEGGGGGGIVVNRYDVGEHYLSAAVLAFVADCPFGFTGSLRLTAGQLDRAIELLGPAGACADGEQPVLRAWRYLREEIGEDGECVAAFAGALDADYELLDDPYAAAIAAEWNVAASGVGYVARFRVLTSFARRYPTREAGGRRRLELWIPAGDVPEVNRNLVGAVELVGGFA